MTPACSITDVFSVQIRYAAVYIINTEYCINTEPL